MIIFQYKRNEMENEMFMGNILSELGKEWVI